MTRRDKVIFYVIVFLSLINKCASIRCFYCNSANNTACTDLTELDDEYRARLIPEVECERAIPSPVAHQFFCRKIVQTIYHAHREPELRVTRGCGWVQSDKDCYRADNRDHLETACQCFTDYCNHAESFSPATATGLFLALAAILYFYR